ncbi:zinc finger protein 397-like isoform X3 [Centruroides sculpturatus]|uniref:zinc finger protein 397-like isoform X3 n=1 Tax=Centruroides sculpturatus TaxID=218467 RepID=UPI000C6D1C3D|nr:zinc finger protein 397-like isoform X3 [Centruroides sculpturatus]
MNPNPDISTDRKSSAIRVEIQNIEMLKKPYCANADILSTLDLDITNIKQEPEWEHENDITSALEFESEEVKFQCNELNIVKVEQDSLDHVIKTELQSVSEDEYSSNNQVNFQESAADDFSNIERERNLHVTQDTNTVSARGICENNRDDINGQNGNNINVVFVPVVVNYVPVLKSILLKPANVPSKNQVEFENKDRPFRCNICQRSFKLKADLARHERLHSDDTPFSCNICKMRFKLKTYLNSHMTIHSKERPFQCNLCKMEFKRKSYLMKHHKMHIFKKPFQCNICKMGFKSKSCLVRHSKFHFGQKN